MKRFSRKKWCPCKSGRRVGKCHGDKIKNLLSILSNDRIKTDYNSCRLL